MAAVVWKSEITAAIFRKPGGMVPTRAEYDTPGHVLVFRRPGWLIIAQLPPVNPRNAGYISGAMPVNVKSLSVEPIWHFFLCVRSVVVRSSGQNSKLAGLAAFRDHRSNVSTRRTRPFWISSPSRSAGRSAASCHGSRGLLTAIGAQNAICGDTHLDNLLFASCWIVGEPAGKPSREFARGHPAGSSTPIFRRGAVQF